MAKSVEKAYGNALLLVAEEKNNVKEMLEEAEEFLRIYSGTPELKRFLNHPSLTKSEKSEKIKVIFRDELSDSFMGLLTVILKKGREENLEGILQFFVKEAKEIEGIGTVSVTTPFPCTPEQKKAVEDKILSSTGYKSLQTEYTVDRSLIGGMIIRVNDTVVDSSIKSKLNALQRNLNNIQL